MWVVCGLVWGNRRAAGGCDGRDGGTGRRRIYAGADRERGRDLDWDKRRRYRGSGKVRSPEEARLEKVGC